MFADIEPDGRRFVSEDQSMDHSATKRASRRLVLELVVVALATYHARLPKDQPYSDAWQYVGKHPLLVVHVVVGAIVLVEAAVLALHGIRTRQPFWVILTVLGLAFVLVAFISGDRFLASQGETPLDLMGVAWFGALVVFAVGWYVGRKRVAVLPNG
jgi:hypothetical protein